MKSTVGTISCSFSLNSWRATSTQSSPFVEDGTSSPDSIRLNIRRHFTHIDGFLSVMQTAEYTPDICVLVETWLTDTDKELAQLDGYGVEHVVRESGCSGGVSVYFRSNLTVRVLKQFCRCNLYIEVCTIEIKLASDVYIVVGIYRPHSGNVDGFVDELGEILSNIPRPLRKKVILIGDFNVNLLNDSSSPVAKLTTFMRSNYLAPLISSATRFPTEHNISPSLLDHIWISFLGDPCNYGSILIDETDHCPIFINIKCNLENNAVIKIKFRDYSQRYLDKFRYKLSMIDLISGSSTNLNDKFRYFEETLSKCFLSSFPYRIKQISRNHMNKPWITDAIKKSIKTKSNYFKLYRRGIITRETNEKYKRMLLKVTKSAKRRYFHNYFSNFSNNMKKSWKGIKNLMGRVNNKNTCKVNPMKVNDTLCTDAQEIANEFNTYFSSIAQQLDDQIPTDQDFEPLSLIARNANSMGIDKVTESETSKMIGNLRNTSYGKDKVSAQLID